MKKMICVLGLLVGVVFSLRAQDTDRRFQMISEIGPTYGTSSVTPYIVTIAAPGAGYRNCIEYVTWQSTNTQNISIQDNGTTDYMILSLPASTPHTFNPVNASFCTSSANTPIVIFSSSTVQDTPLRVNYKGYIRK